MDPGNIHCNGGPGGICTTGGEISWVREKRKYAEPYGKRLPLDTNLSTISNCFIRCLGGCCFGALRRVSCALCGFNCFVSRLDSFISGPLDALFLSGMPTVFAQQYLESPALPLRRALNLATCNLDCAGQRKAGKSRRESVDSSEVGLRVK